MEEQITAVIQAGGKGTRMESLTHGRIPKPMLLLNGKPVLEWQIDALMEYGIRDFVIVIGHLGEQIRNYFGDGADKGVSIRYIEETSPLGSAGALYYLKDMDCSETLLIVFGDVLFDVDWTRMIRFHEERGGSITLVVHPNTHPHDSDVLKVDSDGRVLALLKKNQSREGWYDNLVNSGLSICSRDVASGFAEAAKRDFEEDLVIPEMQKGRVFAYHTSEYVKDSGTPERFAAVSREQEKGVWAKKNLRRRQQCVFMDRDGTINRLRGLIYRPEELELLEGAGDAIRMLNEEGWLAIVVTNQPVVARGLCSIEEVEEIHRKLQVLLGEQGVYVDDIVFCPHHPDKGYPEENPLYKIPCRCRKPGTEMIERMVEKYNIDIARSYMIGDSTVDIQTAKNAGLKSVLVKTGEAGEDRKYAVKPDRVAEDLADAIRQILKASE